MLGASVHTGIASATSSERPKLVAELQRAFGQDVGAKFADSPPELAGAYFLASALGLVAPCPASRLASCFAVRWQDVLAGLPALADQLQGLMRAKCGDTRVADLRSSINRLQIEHVHAAVLLQQLEGLLAHLFCGQWAQPHSHAGHAAWLAFALCRRQANADDGDLVAAFQLLLVVTTELLIPAAPRSACRPNNTWTTDRALADLAALYDLPLDMLHALRAPVRSTLHAALGDDRIGDKNGTLAPWLVPRLKKALDAASSRGGVDEAAVWRDHAPPATPNAMWSPLGALKSLQLDQSPAYVVSPIGCGSPSHHHVASPHRAPSPPSPSAPYRTLVVGGSPSHPADDEPGTVVDSPPPRRAATVLNGTASSAAAWLQQLQLHHQQDADMVQLLCASSPLLGATVLAALMNDVDAQAQRAFRPAAASRLASLLGGRAPAVTRGQEVAVLYTHCASRMLQYEVQVNGAHAVAVLAERGTFRNALLACCIDMVACVYNQADAQFPNMLPSLRITPLDYYKMTEQLLHFERDAPPALRCHLLRGMERCLESLLWEEGSPLLELWRRGAARDDGTASCSHSGTSRAVAVGEASRAEANRAEVNRAEVAQEEWSPRKRQRVPSASSNHSRVLQPQHSSDDSFTQVTGSGPSVRGVTQRLPQEQDGPNDAAEASAGLVALFESTHTKRSHASAFSPFKQCRPPPAPLATVNPGPPHLIAASSVPSLDALSPAQAAMLTNLRQRMLHLASVKLATLTQVAGVNDPTRQCAALRNTTALLQHVLRNDVQLLVGRHLDHVVLGALFCVCEALGLHDVTLQALQEQYKRQAAAQRRAALHANSAAAAGVDILARVALSKDEHGKVLRYGTLAAYVEQVFQPAVAPFVARLAPLTAPHMPPDAGPPAGAHQAGLDARSMLHTPPLMAAPTSSPPACIGAALTTPPSSPLRAPRSATGASGSVIQAARNVFISPMGSAQAPSSKLLPTGTPRAPFTALPLSPQQASPPSAEKSGIALLSTVADILALDA